MKKQCKKDVVKKEEDKVDEETPKTIPNEETLVDPATAIKLKNKILSTP